MRDDTCSWPRCRRTDIEIVFYQKPLCGKHHGAINASDPDGERPMSHHGLEEAKRILKITEPNRSK